MPDQSRLNLKMAGFCALFDIPNEELKRESGALSQQIPHIINEMDLENAQTMLKEYIGEGNMLAAFRGGLIMLYLLECM